MTSKVLKEYDEMLAEHNFIRVHRAHLVNKNYVNSVSPDRQLILTDNTLIDISRRKWEDVKKAVGELKNRNKLFN